MNIVVVSGGFDPIHSGHISYMKSAKDIGDHLIVALNSDEWLIKKKKKVFMNIEERKNIMELRDNLNFTRAEHYREHIFQAEYHLRIPNLEKSKFYHLQKFVRENEWEKDL